MRGVARAALCAADDGDGVLAAMADRVVTAADMLGEIEPPLQGLPKYTDARLRVLPMGARAPRLTTAWLARLPPQAAPPGFRPRPWTDIITPWGRRMITASLNATADREFELWHDGATERRRPAYLCLGAGCAMQIEHADGIGSYSAFSLIWERIEGTDQYGLLDFTRETRTHWNLAVIRELLGDIDDQRLFSYLMHGVRWGVDAPRQIRIAPNLGRMDERIHGVSAAFGKLVEKGLYYKVLPLRRRHEKLRPDGPGPLAMIPLYVAGSGGLDKADHPGPNGEKRVVGDLSAPHDERVSERNKPHGDADGPIAVSLNDMMGPAPNTFERGEPLPAEWPMPDPEVKPSPRGVYRKAAVLSHMAHVGGTSLASIKDDGRHMFFQFQISPEVVGAHISVSNTLWDASATGSSDATVAGYIGKHSFPSGPPSPHTYVILCDECHYAVRHSVVARSIVDSKLRRRISKQGNPKALA